MLAQKARPVGENVSNERFDRDSTRLSTIAIRTMMMS